MRIVLAAVRVTLDTAPSVVVLATVSSLSIRAFPPKRYAKTTMTRTRVSGSAMTGEENQRRMSSIAATPSNASAQFGMEAE